MRQERPPGVVLLEGEVQLKGASGGGVAPQHPQAHAALDPLEEEAQAAPPQTAGFVLRHRHDVCSYPLQEAAGQQDLPAGQVRPLRASQFRLQPLGDGRYDGVVATLL